MSENDSDIKDMSENGSNISQYSALRIYNGSSCFLSYENTGSNQYAQGDRRDKH